MAYAGDADAVPQVGLAHGPVKQHRRFAHQLRGQPHRDHGWRGGQHDAHALAGQALQTAGQNQRPREEVPTAAQYGAIRQQGPGGGGTYLGQKGINNCAGLIGNGKPVVCGRRKPCRRGGFIRLRRVQLTSRRQQAVPRRNKQFQTGDAHPLRIFQAEGQIHEGQTVQPQIAAQRHAVGNFIILRQGRRLPQGRVHSLARLRGDGCASLRGHGCRAGQKLRFAPLPEKARNRLRRELRLIIKRLQPGVELALVAAAGHAGGFHKLHTDRAAGSKQQQVGAYDKRPAQQRPAKMRSLARGTVAKGAAPQPGGTHQHHPQFGHPLQNLGRAGFTAKVFARRTVNPPRRVQQYVVPVPQGIQHGLHARFNSLPGLGPVLEGVGQQHGAQQLCRHTPHGAFQLALVRKRARRVLCQQRIQDDRVNQGGMIGHKQYGAGAGHRFKAGCRHAVAQAEQQSQPQGHKA